MVIISLIETKINLNNIKKQSHYSCPVNVVRNHNFSTIDSTGLVPGDVIEIPDQCFIPCDVVLLSGVCVMNESMLTGESIPAIKNSIPFTDDIYDFK